MKKGIILLLTAALLLVPCGSSFAAKTSMIQASINKLQIKVNGQLAGGNNILYNNTTYVPIRNVTEMLDGVSMNFDAKTNTIHFNKLTAGGEKAGSSAQNDVKDKQRDGRIEVAMNTVKILVDGKQITTSNFMYKGRTYVPMRAISDILKVEVYYHKPNATVYIGTIPKGELTAAAQAPASKLGSVAGTGEMSGWRKLTGHPYENQAAFYYQLEGSIVRYAVKDIRSINLDEVIYWVDDEGRQRANTRRDLHRVFGHGQYASDWLLATFGEVYMDYFGASVLPYVQLINQYLRETGQMKPAAGQVTLEPGTVLTPVLPDPGYGKWADGQVVYYAYDKYGNHKYQFVDTNDNHWNRYGGEPGMPVAPKLSEGWMVEGILEQIYGRQASYDKFKYTLQNEKEVILQLQFPANWHNIDVLETKVGGIRVKKFYYDLRSRIGGEWETEKALETKAGIKMHIVGRSATVDGAFEHRLYKGDGWEEGSTLMNVDIPGGLTAPFESGGLRMKKENGQVHFNVADLYRLGMLEPLQESEGFAMYFNVEDLTAAGILK
ncbi:stalk domain-containing protein [Paenibacillus sp. 1P07SE]|uniref:stalk domain-containing protein n=1 Tax=Paenibacillus sp. 1P07SE TaxID=3132209 RepID=UPI0039A7862B